MDSTAHIVGTGITPMNRRDRTAADMAHQVVADALADADLQPAEVNLVVFGNATAGRLLDQGCIRGQTFLKDAGLRNAGIVNVDNSCAGGASALHLATLATLGGSGTVLAVGVEKMWTGDRAETLAGIEDGVPLDDRRFHARHAREPVGLGADGPQRRVGHDPHRGTGRHRRTVRRGRGQSPPERRPQPQRPVPTAGHPRRGPVLAVHRPPAHPADVLVVHRRGRRRGPRHHPNAWGTEDPDQHRPIGQRRPRLPRASGRDGLGRLGDVGVDPADVDVVELHDATSPEEIYALESLGFFKPGDAGPATQAGDTTLGGGGVTVNTSGGLVSRGHPLGATGIAQVVELATQLRDQAGPRQAPAARLAVAANTGGMIGTHAGPTDAAFIGIHVLEAG